MIDHRDIDWPRVRRASYALRQQFTYDYPGPIADLRQTLVVVPRTQYGDQRLRVHDVQVDAPTAERREQIDAFGNRVLSLHLPAVQSRVNFSIAIELERSAGGRRPLIDAATAHSFRDETSLTASTPALRRAAQRFAMSGANGPLEQAHAINRWVHGIMTYAPDETSVRTVAGEAFALRRGVCQDYAHVMITLCRLNGILARYVSGHLLGEGGTHAWVEVMIPAQQPADGYTAHALDPTHGRCAGLSYLTVASGRDYRDVAPTTGTFSAPYGGILTARKHAAVTAFEYATVSRGSMARLGAA